MFLWISSNYPLNLLLVRNHLAQIFIARRLIQRRNNLTRVGVEHKFLKRLVALMLFLTCTKQEARAITFIGLSAKIGIFES